jgi:hypothetical protein
MEGKVNELELFRNSLYDSAARSLREKHPQYVEAFIQVLVKTRNLSLAINSVKAISTDVGLAKWRPLLTAIFDTEIAINQVKTSLDLLKIIPPKSVVSPHDIPISEGAWVYYHVDVWVFWQDALLERVKKLIKISVRKLIRPFNPQWQNIERDILNSINLLSQDIGKLRDPLAHGGWAVDAPAEEKLWEGTVLVATLTNPHEIISGQVFEPMAQYHAKWYKQLDSKTGLVLDVIDKTIGKIRGNIDWNKI